MKKTVVILFSFFFCSLFSQKKKDAKENVTDYYTKNDSVPFFKFEKAELDTLIQIVFNYPMTAKLMKAKFTDKIGFKLDKTGKITSFNHYKTDLVIPKEVNFKNDQDEQTMYNSLKRESERTLKLMESLWFSDSLRSKQEVVIEIVMLPGEIQNEKYSIVYYTAGSSGKNPYGVGVTKFAVKKTLLASVYFEEAIKRDANAVDAYYNLGACFVKLKNNEKACQNFKKCLELGDKTVQTDIDKYCK